MNKHLVLYILLTGIVITAIVAIVQVASNGDVPIAAITIITLMATSVAIIIISNWAAKDEIGKYKNIKNKENNIW